jgi:transposase
MRRYALRDDQWERIKDLLPGREGHVGVTAKDNRLFVEAVLYRYRAGIPWRDLPERFGDWKAVHTRFSRWAMCGRLRVGKENLHVAGLVGAAMCSAFRCGSHDRWP